MCTNTIRRQIHIKTGKTTALITLQVCFTSDIALLQKHFNYLLHHKRVGNVICCDNDSAQASKTSLKWRTLTSVKLKNN